METSAPDKTSGTMLIAILALAQGLLGILRALRWFEAGSDLFGQGLLLLPMIGMVAFLRGTFVAVLAFLYGVFAWGIYVGRDWARPLGIAVVIVNLLLVVSVLIQGEEPLRALFWLIMPLILLWYLLSHPTRSIGEPKGIRA
jgi:hypothetical protein